MPICMSLPYPGYRQNAAPFYFPKANVDLPCFLTQIYNFNTIIPHKKTEVQIIISISQMGQKFWKTDSHCCIMVHTGFEPLTSLSNHWIMQFFNGTAFLSRNMGKPFYSLCIQTAYRNSDLVVLPIPLRVCYVFPFPHLCPLLFYPSLQTGFNSTLMCSQTCSHFLLVCTSKAPFICVKLKVALTRQEKIG